MSHEGTAPEPRKVFLTFLIQKLAYAHDAIFDYRDNTRGISLLLGIVSSLNEDSKKTLETEKKRLEDLFDHSGKINDREPRVLYDKIDNFLHKTYLEEVNIGIVQSSSVPMGELGKRPEAKPAPAKLSAKLQG